MATSDHNLIGDTTGSTGFSTSTGDILNVSSPFLGPLQNNGGNLQTVQLLAGSPAFGAGDASADSSLTDDERGTGFPRTVNGNIDIGALETSSALPRSPRPRPRSTPKTPLAW